MEWPGRDRPIAAARSGDRAERWVPPCAACPPGEPGLQGAASFAVWIRWPAELAQPVWPARFSVWRAVRCEWARFPPCCRSGIAAPELSRRECFRVSRWRRNLARAGSCRSVPPVAPTAPAQLKGPRGLRRSAGFRGGNAARCQDRRPAPGRSDGKLGASGPRPSIVREGRSLWAEYPGGKPGGLPAG